MKKERKQIVVKLHFNGQLGVIMVTFVGSNDANYTNYEVQRPTRKGVSRLVKIV